MKGKKKTRHLITHKNELKPSPQPSDSLPGQPAARRPARNKHHGGSLRVKGQDEWCCRSAPCPSPHVPIPAAPELQSSVHAGAARWVKTPLWCVTLRSRAVAAVAAAAAVVVAGLLNSNFQRRSSTAALGAPCVVASCCGLRRVDRLEGRLPRGGWSDTAGELPPRRGR